VSRQRCAGAAIGGGRTVLLRRAGGNGEYSPPGYNHFAAKFDEKEIPAALKLQSFMKQLKP